MKKNIFLKKLLAGITALTACACTFTSVSADEILKGDSNCDGSVSAADVVTLKAHLLNITPLSDEAKAAADINGDSEINVIDFILLKNILIKDTASSESSIISLSDDGITVSGDGVSAEGKKVTISKGGSYSVTGSASDVQLIVAAAEDDKDAVEIALDNVSVTCSEDSAFIMVENADKTKITFTGTNTLVNTFEGASAASAAIYAKDDLTFTKNSSGTLEINTNSCMGIYCNNDIKFNGGKITVKTDTDGTGTASADAVKAKGSVENAGADIKVNAAGDGIKSTKDAVLFSGGNTVIKSGKDAVQASVSAGVSGGTLVASGDRGITSEGIIYVTGGSVFATATDNQATFTGNQSTQKMIGLEFAEEHSKDDAVKIDNTEYKASKKYKYVLISDESLSTDKPFSVFCGDVAFTHADSADGRFMLSDENFTQFSGLTVNMHK